jgi:hypothetical protein
MEELPNEYTTLISRSRETNQVPVEDRLYELFDPYHFHSSQSRPELVFVEPEKSSRIVQQESISKSIAALRPNRHRAASYRIVTCQKLCPTVSNK